jgi:hypothetical protein
MTRQFRGGYQTAGAEGGQGVTYNTLFLKPNSGFQLEEGYMAGSDSYHMFRIIPAFDAEGEECHMNPEGKANMPVSQLLGNSICEMEVVDSIGKTSNICSFITDVRNCRNGQVISDRWSAAKIMLRRVFWKLKEAHLRKSMGADPGVPQAWMRWNMDKAFRQPTRAMFVQSFFQYVNGQPCINPQTGQPGWSAPTVLRIPASAAPKFISDLFSAKDPSQPLSLQNNDFGDPFSVAQGQMLKMRKIPKSVAQGSDDSGFNYDLSALAPLPLTNWDVGNVWKPWNQVLNIPSDVDTLLEWLANCFDWQAVAYGLRGSDYAACVPQQYTDSVLHIADSKHLDDVKKELAGQQAQQVPPFPQDPSTTAGPPATMPAATQAVVPPPPPPASAPAPQQAAPPPAPAQRSFQPTNPAGAPAPSSSRQLPRRLPHLHLHLSRLRRNSRQHLLWYPLRQRPAALCLLHRLIRSYLLRQHPEGL